MLNNRLPERRPLGVFGNAVCALRPWSPTPPRNVRVLVEPLRAALRAGFSPGSTIGR